jgi:phosphoribosyl 1,2-cyclic phosphodiesterase
MSLKVWALASGSSGNSFLIQGGRTTVLLDAGFSAKAIAAKIASVGVDPQAVEALFVTHEHSDHMCGAGVTCRALKAPLVANAATLAAAARSVGNTDVLEMPTGTEVCIGDLSVRSFSVSHDAADPVGYVFQCGPHRACYVTDTGRITPSLWEHTEGAHLLVLESNHDVPRLAKSDYPDMLKRRILGDRGHLSNDVASRALADLSLRDQPCVAWLAHLSAENNTPRPGLSHQNGRRTRGTQSGAQRGTSGAQSKCADPWSGALRLRDKSLRSACLTLESF